MRSPFLILGIVINQVEHVDGAAGLAETLDATESLFKPRRIPREIRGDQCA